MTKYLVQKFLWFRERGFVQITPEDFGLSLSIFTFFSNCSSDFPVLLFR